MTRGGCATTRWLGIAAAALLASAVLGSAPAVGHPHAWIDLRSKVMLNADGEVSGIELYWLFDQWYTIYIADEFNKSGASSTDYLTSLGQQNLANLAEYDYFTKVIVNGEPVKTGEVTAFKTGIEDERLWLQFEVPLEEAVGRSDRVVYKIYDPTYYIEILHQEGEPVTFAGPGAEECAGEIVPANPSFDAVALASALDVTQTAGDGLGEVFAETVNVTCQ